MVFCLHVGSVCVGAFLGNVMLIKRKPYRNKKILAHARGQECTINSPNCNGNSDTVVACHSNWSEDGKGTGQKADDCFVAYGCSDCHAWLDSDGAPKEERQYYFHRGMKRTWRILLDDGILA